MVTHIAWYDLTRRKLMKTKVKDAIARFSEVSHDSVTEIILNDHHRGVNLPGNTIPVRFESFVPKGVVYVGSEVDGSLGIVQVDGPDMGDLRA